MAKRPIPADEQGMILVNVLLFVAIASALVLLMINREELALDRTSRLREAARAAAIVRGGELSAVTALRRDMIAAPDSDDATEAWAAIADSNVRIDGGSFDLAVADAQGRFNLNNLRSNDAVELGLFNRITEAAGLSIEQRALVYGYVIDHGPIIDLRPLRLAGLEADKAARLEAMVTALPDHTKVNINAAPAELMAVLFADVTKAAQLDGVRAAKGVLSAQDLTDAKVTLPPNAGFTSRDFWVHTRVRIGDTAQQSAALIQRRRSQVDGTPDVVVVQRWLNTAIPPGVPDFGGGVAKSGPTG